MEPGPDIRFKVATPGDACFLGPMNKRLIEDEGHRNAMAVPELVARMEGWLRGEYGAVYGERDGAPAAYALFRKEPDYVYLRQLYVEREERRQGLGRALVTWIAGQVAGPLPLRMDVLVGNRGGLAFWRALGFRAYCLTLERPPPCDRGPDRE